MQRKAPQLLRGDAVTVAEGHPSVSDLEESRMAVRANKDTVLKVWVRVE